MRRILRIELPHHLARYLKKKQCEIDEGKDASTLWKNARGTQSMEQVFEVLASMSGNRQRCMFCGDSRGVDIDHFYPKEKYPDRTFDWDNLILSCTGCNRAKGRNFQLDSNGLPLIIDPTKEDPWKYFYFDFRTGLITYKYNIMTKLPDHRGYHTIEQSGLPLNHQAIAEGRLRTYRNLVRCITRFLGIYKSHHALACAQCELFKCIDDNSNYGLSEWFFKREGKNDSPFADLQNNESSIWLDLLKHLS
jgi:uncharacterized protein (TIGR02646 family)